jgi:hypothetical protein
MFFGLIAELSSAAFSMIGGIILEDSGFSFSFLFESYGPSISLSLLLDPALLFSFLNV